MRKIKVLAWDDERAYLDRLALKLEDFQIYLEVEEREENFILRFENEKWDFIILDVIDKSIPGAVRRNAGIKLAERIRQKNKHIFILFVTDDGRIIAQETAITAPFHTRSKILPDGAMINDIRDFIELYVPDMSKVFLLGGRDRKAGQIRNKLTKLLQACGLQVDSSGFEDSANKLVEKMSQCGAIIALCTPDEKCVSQAGEYFQPFANVLVGMGMVMGLNRGAERLLILRKIGQNSEETARLPDILQNGDSVIQFDDEIDHEAVLAKVIESLRLQGTNILI